MRREESVRKVVACAITRRYPGTDPQVLLVQRREDSSEFPREWMLPATVVEAHESWDSALVRCGIEQFQTDLGQNLTFRSEASLKMDCEAVIPTGCHASHVRLMHASIHALPCLRGSRGAAYRDLKWMPYSLVEGYLRDMFEQGMLSAGLFLWSIGTIDRGTLESYHHIDVLKEPVEHPEVEELITTC